MRTFFTLLILLCISGQAVSQGCVAIRSTGSSCSLLGHRMDSTEVTGSWSLGTFHRYFKSFRHFKGKEEQKERLQLGNEVINYQYSLDIVLTRTFNNRWSAMIDIPILANSRSSLYEHGRTERHATHSFGLGDVRIAAFYWLLNPQLSQKGNIQLGLGIKLPTGDYNYKDYWHNVGPDGEKELRTVDQSIQLGDGGTGITAELNTFYHLSQLLSLYGNFYYLSNPREHNGVRTYREMVSENLANEAIMSVPDQYLARLGLNFPIKSLTASAGARLEGIPVYDLLGGSGEFRRPGYIISAEPGLSYQQQKMQVFVSAPIALVRNRTQSVTDKENSRVRETFVNGDAAFSDYAINLGLTFKL